MTLEQGTGRRWAAGFPLVLALIALLTIVAAGYYGFITFATLGDMSALNLYVLAVVAGVASFFSPCAFPLLPSYFSFYHSAGQREAREVAGGETLLLGLAAALGVLTFNLGLGIAIALLGGGLGESLSISASQPSLFVRVFRGFIGLALILLGVGQLRNWSLKPEWVGAFINRCRPRREAEDSGSRSLFLYGLGYSAAGIGCTGPILAGLILFALSSGGFWIALTAFAIFSLTMSSLMTLLSVLVGASQHSLIQRLKVATSSVKRVSGGILLLVGAFNIYSSINLDWFLRVLFP